MTLTIIFVIINLILWLSFYIKFKKTFSPKKILENIASEVDKLLIEIDKTTDRDLSLLESKIQTLREVISYADKRILMAEKEESKRKMEQDVISKIDEIKQNIPQDNSSMKTYVKKAYKISDKQKHSAEISLFPADTFGIDINQMNKKEVEPDNDIRSLKEKVLELFHQGLDIYYIAEKLDSSVAEVQTIVNLFGN